MSDLKHRKRDWSALIVIMLLLCSWHDQALFIIYKDSGCLKLNLRNYLFEPVSGDPILEVLELDDHSILELPLE